MAAKSLQDQVATLLSKKVAERKVRGTPVPEVEAAALFESIAISFAARPSAVLYLAHLARNGLVKAASDEIVAVDALLSALNDLGNVSYTIKETSEFEKARSALLQIEAQDRVRVTSPAFGRFDRAVGAALKQLSVNVVSPGSDELLRPSTEAELDIGPLYGAVQTLHDDMLKRLYAASVGVQNFMSSPVLSIVSISTVQNVREDVEAMLDDLAAGDAAPKSRDFVNRLLVGRAALRVLGAPLALPETGPLASMWQAVQPALEDQAQTWLASDFGQGLTSLDLAIAGITSASTVGQIAQARRILTDLREYLTALCSALTGPRLTGVAEERQLVEGVFSALEERGYTRAVSMLLRCQIAEFFELDWQTASYAGALMKASSDIARTDLLFENREKDESRAVFVRED